MMILGTERTRLISGLGLPEPLLALTRGEPPHPELKYWCRKLAYSTEPEDMAPKGLDMVPLWEGENSITGFVLRDGRPVFIHFDVEYIDEYRELGGDIGSVVHDLLDNIDDGCIADVARALGYEQVP